MQQCPKSMFTSGNGWRGKINGLDCLRQCTFAHLTHQRAIQSRLHHQMGRGSQYPSWWNVFWFHLYTWWRLYDWIAPSWCTFWTWDKLLICFYEIVQHAAYTDVFHVGLTFGPFGPFPKFASSPSSAPTRRGSCVREKKLSSVVEARHYRDGQAPLENRIIIGEIKLSEQLSSCEVPSYSRKGTWFQKWETFPWPSKSPSGAYLGARPTAALVADVDKIC